MRGRRRSSAALLAALALTLPACSGQDPAATPEADPTGADTAETRQCWDSTTGPPCPPLKGRRALEWLFPAMAGQACERIAAPDRRLIFACTATLSNGVPIRLNYSEWHDRAEALAHYDQRPDDRQFDAGSGTMRWKAVSASGQHKAAVMYETGPWSASLYADTAADRDLAIEELIILRPLAEVQAATQ